MLSELMEEGLATCLTGRKEYCCFLMVALCKGEKANSYTLKLSVLTEEDIAACLTTYRGKRQKMICFIILRLNFN